MIMQENKLFQQIPPHPAAGKDAEKEAAGGFCAMKKVFIDGSAGTTGLRIAERLAGRDDLSLITLQEEQRKDSGSRARALNDADIAVLCLPDAAAREAVSWIENPDTVVLDTSTAHRTAPGWVYGFPELSATHAHFIRTAKRIAVPGCHASGFIALTAPLTAAGILPPKTLLSCFSLTGYSGGGKKMIAEYETQPLPEALHAPQQYALGQSHKHLPEMAAQSGLPAPAFCPVVGNFYSGMQVTVPLFAAQCVPGTTPETIAGIYRKVYTGPVVSFAETPGENGFLSAVSLAGKDSMRVSVTGNEERMLLLAVYDNLGKGASGAAVECLNMVLGTEPTKGLCL